MLNPIIALLHNPLAQRWHPVLFYESPLPGPDTPDKPVRHRSKGHHTEGFATREEALAYIETEMLPAVRKISIGEPTLSCDKAFPWDGDGVPAMVVYFSAPVDGKCVPMIA
jgi:hypothetical protein